VIEQGVMAEGQLCVQKRDERICCHRETANLKEKA
jgi:hypothetical protein